MNVVMKLHLNRRHQGIVYASLEEAPPNESVKGKPICAATFDYCVDVAKNRGYNITNAQEVLEWLHKNADVIGHPVR